MKWLALEQRQRFEVMHHFSYAMQRECFSRFVHPVFTREGKINTGKLRRVRTLWHWALKVARTAETIRQLSPYERDLYKLHCMERDARRVAACKLHAYAETDARLTLELYKRLCPVHVVSAAHEGQVERMREKLRQAFRNRSNVNNRKFNLPRYMYWENVCARLLKRAKRLGMKPPYGV